MSNASAFVYRFDYCYQSNHACSAVPNFHLPYLGAVHQDEVTFVMGQPNFMEQGSCCGKWGLSEGEESCEKTPSCVDCYDAKLGDGYHAYFNDKEFTFARTVGKLWTSFARSGSSHTTHWPKVCFYHFQKHQQLDRLVQRDNSVHFDAVGHRKWGWCCT